MKEQGSIIKSLQITLKRRSRGPFLDSTASNIDRTWSFAASPIAWIATCKKCALNAVETQLYDKPLLVAKDIKKSGLGSTKKWDWNMDHEPKVKYLHPRILSWLRNII